MPRGLKRTRSKPLPLEDKDVNERPSKYQKKISTEEINLDKLLSRVSPLSEDTIEELESSEILDQENLALQNSDPLEDNNINGHILHGNTSSDEEISKACHEMRDSILGDYYPDSAYSSKAVLESDLTSIIKSDKESISENTSDDVVLEDSSNSEKIGYTATSSAMPIGHLHEQADDDLDVRLSEEFLSELFGQSTDPELNFFDERGNLCESPVPDEEQENLIGKALENMGDITDY